MNEDDWDRISKDYHDEIISPITDSVNANLLFDAITKKNKKKNSELVVGDLGCGTGGLISFLSENFNHVHALDFSSGMIDQAKLRNASLDNVSYYVQDLGDLSQLKNTLDVAITVNSILVADIAKLQAIIAQIFDAVKSGGKCVAVLPAMESYLYQAMLLIDSQIDTGLTQAEAVKKAKSWVRPKEYDFLQGLITFGGDTQKTFYTFEILHRFKKAGFVNLRLEKIHYDWSAWKDAGQTYFPDEESPWDWLLVCDKP
jgi:SAM-dependent methyltransferase